MNRLTAFLLLSLSALTACTSSSSDGSSAPSPSNEQTDGDVAISQSSLPRATAPSVPPSDAKTLTHDNTAFAADLYRVLRQSPELEQKNIFFSPHSISVALAMTYAGARGNTATEMQSALHFTLPDERLHPAFDALDLALASRGTNAKAADGLPFRLRVTNSLWGLPKMPFEQPFLDTLAQNYGSGIRLTDFRADPEAARQTINGWVDKQTEQRISELLPPQSISELTRLVLVNAVYFNAAWSKPFDPAITKAGTFHGLAGDTSASFMANTTSARHARGADFDAVAVPYDGNELELLAIVPDAGKLGDVEARLDGAMFESVASSLVSKEVELHMPKFEIKGSSFSLKKTLDTLGMKAPFTPDADFSGMLSRAVDTLYIGDVIHQAFVSVDEKGTEAAAATAVLVLGNGAAPTDIVKLTMDRPFIFAIRDVATGALVFVGRVAQP